MPLTRERRDLAPALYESAMRFDLHRVEELIAAGAVVNAPVSGIPSLPRYVTLLHALAGLSTNGDGRAPCSSLQIMESLIHARANLNPRSSDGTTPLMLACSRKNVGATQFLLDAGADISPIDDNGYDCFMWAAVLPERRRALKPTPPPTPSSHPGAPEPEEKAASADPGGEDGVVSAEIMKMLVSAERAQAEHKAMMSPIPSSSEWDSGTLGHLETRPVEKLVTKGSPLLVAVCHTNHEAAAVLLESGMPAVGLHEAARSGSLELVKVLLEWRADPLEKDKNSETPMDIALQGNEDSMIMDVLREAARYSTGACFDSDSSIDKPLKRRLHSSKDRNDISARRKSLVMSKAQVDAECGRGSRSARLFQRLPAGVRRCCVATKNTTEYWGEEVSRCCRQVFRSQIFQGIMLATLLGALFIPDLWVIFEATSDMLLDGILFVLLVAFVVEVIIQAVGLRCAYLRSFFFYMDLIGAGSLLLDLSSFRDWTSSSAFGDNAVIMRAARAARLGARAGRFTKLMKLLRFLHGAPPEQTESGTAKGLTSVLVTRLSILVSCLIITLTIVLPIFELLKYPEQDWAMQMWVGQLADAIEEGATSAEVNALVQDFRSGFQDRGYQPHCLKWRNHSTEVLLWQRDTKLRPMDEFTVVVGKVTAMFNWASVNQTEAINNLAMMVFSIVLLVSFSSMISKSVSKIALVPLEMLLSKVRLMGANIYRNVETMNKQFGFPASSSRPDVDSGANGDAWEDYARETALPTCIVQKLVTLSEIVMRKTQPNDDQALQYLALQYVGEVRSCDNSVACKEDTGFYSEENFEQFSEAFSEEQSSWNVCSWDFNPLGLKLADTIEICNIIFGHVTGKVPAVGEDQLFNFFNKASAGYLKGPQYHNWFHAVDVTQMLFLLLHRCSRHCTLVSALEEYALLASAVCHDIGHLGVTNDFLVQTSNDLAIRYNDTSPLENMHCARLFEIVKTPNTEIFSMLSKAQYKEVRSICVEAILHTDNKHHFDCVRRLQMFGEMNSELLQRAQDLYQRTAQPSEDDPQELIRSPSNNGGSQTTLVPEHWPPRELLDAMWAQDTRTHIRNALFHFADISNPVRPFHICEDWSVVILEEFFAQGDIAKQRGLPVMALQDREKTNLAFSQIGFIDFFAAPLVFAMVRLLAPVAELAEQLINNTNTWAKLWLDEATRSDEEVNNLSQRVKRLEDRAAVILRSQIGPTVTLQSVNVLDSPRHKLSAGSQQ